MKFSGQGSDCFAFPSFFSEVDSAEGRASAADSAVVGSLGFASVADSSVAMMVVSVGGRATNQEGFYTRRGEAG